LKRTNIFLKDAAALIKSLASAKFDESVDIAFGCRSKKSESNGKRCGNITSWNW
jgi:ribosomal protein L1